MSAGWNRRLRKVGGHYVKKFCDYCGTQEGEIFPVVYGKKQTYYCWPCYKKERPLHKKVAP